MKEKIINRIKSMNEKEKLIAGACVAEVIIFLFAAYVVGNTKKGFAEMHHFMDPDYHFNGFWYAITEGIGSTLFFTIVFTVLAAGVGYKIGRKYFLFSKDERGFQISRKGAYGTSSFMRSSQIDDEYRIIDIETDAEYMTILGQLTEEGTHTVTLKKPRFPDELRNMLVIGSSGTSKSRGFVISEIINSAYRGESVLVSDPSGELYLNTASILKKRGLNVYALNCVDPEHSDSWDLLSLTLNSETERLDGTLLNMFVSVFLRNTSAGEMGDRFWYELASGYLKAAIGYAAYKRETTIISDLKSLYTGLFPDLSYKEVSEIFNSKASIKECKNRLFHDALNKGVEWNQISKYISNVERMAPPFTIQQVHNLLMDFDPVEEAYRNDKFIPDTFIGKIAYKTCSQRALSENVKASGILGTLGKLSLFTDEKLSFNLSEPGIDLRDINKNPCAVFLISPEDNADMRAITSLFITFAFVNAKETYDKARQVSESQGIKNPTLPLSIILDEFHSIGVIGGTPDVFVTYMSDSRKRLIHISLIIQNITQIASLYGKSNAETIISNCNTTLFFGANDPETKRYISELSGQVTVMTDSYGGTYAEETVMSSGKRNLLTPDEAGRIRNEVIVFRHGCYPLRLNIFDYRSLPVFRSGDTRKVSLAESTVPFEQRYRDPYRIKKDRESLNTAVQHMLEDDRRLSLECTVPWEDPWLKRSRKNRQRLLERN